MADQTTELPLSYKVTSGEKRPSCILSNIGHELFVSEARQLGHHFKEAVVQEGLVGSSWRMTSDEGSYLGGTDLAPFPLGFFNAGLQSDLAGRIGRLAKVRGINCSQVTVDLTTRYSLSGSFVQGTGKGYAEEVGVHVMLQSAAADSDLAALISDAVAESPAFNLVTHPLENTFALYCNGRRRNTVGLAASAAPAPLDPFLKYAVSPIPLPDNTDLGELILKTGTNTDGAASSASTSTPTPGGRITWAVNGQGSLDASSGLF